MKKLLSTLFISTALLFVGCEGDEGPQGSAGADGNANVKAAHIEIAPDAWETKTVNTNQGPVTYYQYGYTGAQINSDLYNNGVFYTYFKNNDFPTLGDSRYLSLPVTWSNNLGQVTRRLDVDSYYAQSADTLNFIVTGNPLTDTIQLKIVTIDGNPAKVNPEVDFGNYEMVKDYFGIEE